MSTPTLHSVQAHVKRAAKAQGLGFKATRKHDIVLVESLYSRDAENLGLVRYEGQTSSWLRSVLTEDELLQVEVCVVVNNSDPMIDFFDHPPRRVAANWRHLVDTHGVSATWAYECVHGEGTYEFDRYGRGDLAFTSNEVEELAPSAYAARGLAAAQLAFNHSKLMKLSGPARAGNWAELVADRAATRDRIMSLDTAALELFLVMLPDWTLDIAGLVDAVCVLVPQEAPAAPVTPAAEPEVPVQGLTEQPQALSDYLGRLLHVPKRDFAQAVWFSLANGAPVPSHEAPWADDVIKKVRRYASA